MNLLLRFARGVTAFAATTSSTQSGQTHEDPTVDALLRALDRAKQAESTNERVKKLIENYRTDPSAYPEHLIKQVEAALRPDDLEESSSARCNACQRIVSDPDDFVEELDDGGEETVMLCREHMYEQRTEPCPDCDGGCGEPYYGACSTCLGTGVVPNLDYEYEAEPWPA